MGDEDECLDVGALQAHADGPTTFGVHVAEQRHVKHSYDVLNELDVLFCDRPQLWLDITKLET